MAECGGEGSNEGFHVDRSRVGDLSEEARRSRGRSRGGLTQGKR